MINIDIPALSVQGDDGIMREYYITGKFSYENRDYIALVSQDGNGDITELFRCSDGGDDKIKIENITSDEELEEAKKIYENFLQTGNNSVAGQDELKIIPVPDKNGVYHDCEIITTFNYKDKDYIALMPVEANKDGSASIMLYAYRTTPLNDEFDNIYFEEIPINIYDDVRSYFMELIQSEK